jgi:hypothetical protein
MRRLASLAALVANQAFVIKFSHLQTNMLHYSNDSGRLLVSSKLGRAD